MKFYILGYECVLLIMEYCIMVKCFQGFRDSYDTSTTDMRYILETEGCKIHEFNIKYPKYPPHLGWACEDRLVTVYKSVDNMIRFKMLKHFDTCCYRMTQYHGMHRVEEFPCLNFTDGMEVKLTSDFLSVGCNTKGEPFYTDRFVFIKEKQVKAVVNKDAYSVLILGIDSVSRHRAHSQLSGTVKYLLENQWLDFRGLHQIASGTNPNILAVITGNTSLAEYCDNFIKCKDKMIWEKYKDAGYITGLGEDGAEESIFYYDESVTHHYLNPFLRNIEHKGRHKRCAGKMHSGLQVLTYALDFARTYSFRRSFGYFGISTFAQKADSNLKSADKMLTYFFKELRRSGALERSIVILFSDSGIGSGMSDQEIFPDNRLPMFFMWVPLRFREKHPRLYRNLVANQNRLITPYNIHMTLYGILKMANKTLAPYAPVGCPHCKSLFREISGNLDCVTEGIAEEFCSCNAIPVSSSSEDAQYSLMEALFYIEDLAVHTRTMPCTMCQRYQFDTTYGVQTYRYGNVSERTFLLTIKMQPNDTVFEVTVKRMLHKSDGAATLLKNDEKWNLDVMRKSLKNQYEYKAQTIKTISQFADGTYKEWCAIQPKTKHFCVCIWDRHPVTCDNDFFTEIKKFLRTPIEEINFEENKSSHTNIA